MCQGDRPGAPQLVFACPQLAKTEGLSGMIALIASRAPKALKSKLAVDMEGKPSQVPATKATLVLL